MNLSSQAQAVLLLTAWLSSADRAVRPLTPPEWGRFAHWLKERGAAPDVLLSERNPAQILEGWSVRSVTVNRIASLLDRSAALGLALEKWERAGLWVMTRSDPDYPARLKKRLKFDAPPVLFGCGNRQLLSRGGIAIIGSRDASESELEFTRDLVKKIADQGVSVVSGGARGVDETAMLGALEHEGTVTGVLADSLLRVATSAKYRRGLIEKNAVLISPFNPEAGFDVGNAMARNKYIYCLSDAAVAIAVSKGKGGTWNGAVENLRANWIPLWVKRSGDASSGCGALVDLGAGWLPDSGIHVKELVAVATPNTLGNRDLFATTPDDVKSAHVVREPTCAMGETDQNESTAKTESDDELTISSAKVSAAQAASRKCDRSLYDHFLESMSKVAGREALTIEFLCEQLDLHKSQVASWLKRATSEGVVVKLKRPVRYQLAETFQSKMF